MTIRLYTSNSRYIAKVHIHSYTPQTHVGRPYVINELIMICRVGVVAMRCGNSRVGDDRASGSMSSYIAVRSVDEVEVTEEVKVFGTGRMGGYIPIQVDLNVVQWGRMTQAFFSGHLPGIVLLLDLTRGFVLDNGCLYADVSGARTTARSCWRQVVLVTCDSVLSLPYMVILRHYGGVIAAILQR